MLTAGGIRCGRFTSPHLIDRWDCITINDKVVAQPLFRVVEEEVNARNRNLNIGASEFELLTATAFDIFTREKIEVGVVEVGMGGTLDATNILDDKLVTVITKIGFDHEAFLGHTIEEIARHKAGIMRPGIPCVIDGTNSSEVLKALETHASEVGADPVIVFPDHIPPAALNDQGSKCQRALEPHQLSNLSCAKKALDLSIKSWRSGMDASMLVDAALASKWPGRLQHLNLRTIVSRDEDVLLDGAHNAQSAEALRCYVDRELRAGGHPVTWVLASSKGKNLHELFGSLVRDGDNVITVKFGPVEGMPWVQPADGSEILTAFADKQEVHVRDSGADILSGLAWAAETAAGKPLVIAGSLYLVSDVLRLLRDRNTP
jgi:folylpolyglutamate synthase